MKDKGIGRHAIGMPRIVTTKNHRDSKRKNRKSKLFLIRVNPWAKKQKRHPRIAVVCIFIID